MDPHIKLLQKDIVGSHTINGFKKYIAEPKKKSISRKKQKGQDSLQPSVFFRKN